MAGFCQLSGISSRSRLPVKPCPINKTAAKMLAATCNRRQRSSRRISGLAPNENNISQGTKTKQEAISKLENYVKNIK
jgi:aminoglycoside phosphotransferase